MKPMFSVGQMVFTYWFATLKAQNLQWESEVFGTPIKNVTETGEVVRIDEDNDANSTASDVEIEIVDDEADANTADEVDYEGIKHFGDDENTTNSTNVTDKLTTPNLKEKPEDVKAKDYGFTTFHMALMAFCVKTFQLICWFLYKPIEGIEINVKKGNTEGESEGGDEIKAIDSGNEGGKSPDDEVEIDGKAKEIETREVENGPQCATIGSPKAGETNESGNIKRSKDYGTRKRSLFKRAEDNC